MRDRRNRRTPSHMASVLEYDLVVIGSGPGGQKAAIAAAKLGKTVAVIERGRMLGGVCVNTGTIPSQDTARSGGLPDRHEPARAVRRQLPGQGEDHARRPAGPHHARHHQGAGRGAQPADAQPGRPATPVTAGSSTSTPSASRTRPAAKGSPSGAEYIVIATGTKPARPAGVEFDEERVLDSDGILDLKSHPVVDGGRRRGCDRHRVRVDVRRARHEGHRRREARHHAGLLRSRRSSRR